MIGKGGIALLAAGLLAACEPSAPVRSEPPEAPSPYRTAVVSTGAPLLNEEYGVSAVFPTGARVCEALSGDHPHGFYSRLGDTRMECVPSSDLPKVSSIVIWADYNAAGRSIEELTDAACPEGVSVPADGDPMTFRGRQSVACEARWGDDVRISVTTFVGTEWKRFGGPNWDGARPVPRLVHTAFLNTTGDRSETDKATFRRFLQQVVFSPPETAPEEPACVPGSAAPASCR